MLYAADMTQQDGSGLRHDVGGASHDSETTQTGHADLRITVEDAARLLDITVDAVRKRIERGSLQSEKVNNTRYVVLDTDMIRHDDILGTAPEHNDTDITHMVASLEEQVAFLREVIRSRDHELRRREEEYREESRRKDHLLAAALERIPELEPASEAPEDPETAAAAAEGVETPIAEEKRSFLRRFFGL